MAEINQPFSNKVTRNFLVSKRQAEDIGYLCGEDGYSDTAGETYDNRIRNELYDGSQFEYS